MTEPAYEGGHVKRQRATKAEMQHRYDALYEIVRENKPTGIRFCYYRATTRGVVAKTDSGYNMVQRAILDMRRSGRIPWHWVVDSSRWMRKPDTWGSVEELLADAGASYRRALWRDSESVVEVWCESESVAGVLYPTTAKWDVPLHPLKGQTSDSFAWGAAVQYRDDPRPLTIFYLGDHDPAGYEIETNLHAKLVEFSGRVDIEFLRLAVDFGDVQQLGLTGTTPKKPSYRDKVTGGLVPWHGPAVEVEAVDPPMLRRWLDACISDKVDHEALRLLRVAEESEREILLRMAGEAS
ncbi:MAG: hypothetical protein GEV09_01975 [Pseudonocardiaceae bacterium]|nr:hypothetical protein [Pseudonocardiaceae bacterium]